MADLGDFEGKKRHPQGRTCRGMLPLVILLMPYALIRYAIDQRRERRAGAGGGRG